MTDTQSSRESFDADLVAALETLLQHAGVKAALDAVKTRLPDAIERQKELVLIEAPTHHEEKKARRYAEMLADAGLEDLRVDEHFNVWGYLRGSGRTGKSILIEGHLDTVFAFGDVKGVTTDELGRIHCPGICDDTRALAANLNVLWALKSTGLRPVHDIVFAGTVCEEGLGGTAGMGWLLDTLQKETEVLATISIDGPTAENFYANATGIVDWKVEISGPGGHAWLKHGTPSAIQAAGRAVALISDLEAPQTPKTSFTVSLIEGGQAIHGIAEHAKFTANLRSNSQAVLEELNRGFLAACQQGVEREEARWGCQGTLQMTARKILSIPAGAQPDDARIVQTAKLVTRAAGVEPNFLPGGCTNANTAIAKGYPAVTLGRGGEEFGAHTLAEWFNPEGVWRCEQKSVLMLLMLAGLTGETEPLGDTLA